MGKNAKRGLIPYLKLDGIIRYDLAAVRTAVERMFGIKEKSASKTDEERRPLDNGRVVVIDAQDPKKVLKHDGPAALRYFGKLAQSKPNDD